ncbi:MAG: mannose-1-phosphate guanyltransferase [Gammaproteobacteria bacterium RIFCSPHIGHO2_12_FULL_43_28]|nr:MAG: mannose-1-phosphate guanyltransferase [Gammaproteobacteria bacterium RIFCSPHIGHO2_12_FULL_43_28]
MRDDNFSLVRLWGLTIKEFRQFRRDFSTFMIIISLPILQLILFGLAIDTNPKNLPAALINYDSGPFSRSLIQGLENTAYFKFSYLPPTEQTAARLMIRNQSLFTLNIPPDFSRKLVRGEHPVALLEVDGTDPVSVAYAVSASGAILPTVFQYDLTGPLNRLDFKGAAAEIRVHTKYNPSILTQYNIVPGLLGVVLTMTFVLVASMALTKEREQGTAENLLSTPIKPIEVMIGKSIPFIVVGYLQVIVVLFIARVFFAIPMVGSFALLLLVTMPFILANLFVGIMISTLSKTQLEASQISIFFFLPSFILSGFAFPYYGMPYWARMISDVLPLTHFINIIRGIMLKGATFTDIWVDLWPLLLFMVVMLMMALRYYKDTLD